MDIWTYIKYYIYVCTAHDSDLLILLFFHLAAMTVTSEISRWVSNRPSVTNFRDLVLWKCSYGPWDHFMFSVKTQIRLCFSSQSPVF